MASPNAPEVEIRFELLDWQREVKESPAKYKVVCIGRQAGKTFFGVTQAIECALGGGHVLWLAPTVRQSLVGWELLLELMNQIKEAMPFRTNLHEKAIRLANGGRIECKTADNPDNLRGLTINLAVIDEASIVKPDIWKVINYALAIRRGTAIFISTPRGKNWFYDLYLRGQRGDEQNWQSWQLPSSVNPYLPSDTLENARKDPRCNYQEEFLAEFTTDGHSVFRNVDNCINSLWLSEALEGRDYVLGVDWGKQHDYTVISVIDRDSKELVHVESFNKIDYSLQRQKLFTIADKFNPSRIICEENSIGTVNIEELRKHPVHGRVVEGFTTTMQSKRRLIDALILAFSQETISILNDTELVGQLERFYCFRTEHGNLTYSAPSGFHDDHVISLALAYHGTLPKYNQLRTFDRSLLPI